MASMQITTPRPVASRRSAVPPSYQGFDLWIGLALPYERPQVPEDRSAAAILEVDPDDPTVGSHEGIAWERIAMERLAVGGDGQEPYE